MKRALRLVRMGLLLAVAWAPSAQAKPIAFQGGHTLMLEYGAGTVS